MPWINGWVNTGEAGDLRRHRTHYDVSVVREHILNVPTIEIYCQICRHGKMAGWRPLTDLRHQRIQSVQSGDGPGITTAYTITIRDDRPLVHGCFVVAESCFKHDDVIRKRNDRVYVIWKCLPHYWPFVRGIDGFLSQSARSAELWCSLVLARRGCWTNSPFVGDLRCCDAHLSSL